MKTEAADLLSVGGPDHDGLELALELVGAGVSGPEQLDLAFVASGFGLEGLAELLVELLLNDFADVSAVFFQEEVVFFVSLEGALEDLALERDLSLQQLLDLLHGYLGVVEHHVTVHFTQTSKADLDPQLGLDRVLEVLSVGLGHLV